MAKIVFGCGYVGLRVARRWLADGERVFALTRSAERAEQFRSLGLHPLIGDLTESVDRSRLTEVRSALFAVGHDRSSGKSIREVYVGGLERALQALPQRLDRLLYISSTGVYGQAAGRWVDEDSPCEPVREGGRACLEAERLLADHPLGGCAIVLRLAGIYGPGRLPQADALVAGRPLSSRPEGTINLIHVEDAVAVILAAEQRATAPRRFTVSDGHPVKRRDFYTYLSELMGLPAPCFGAAPTDRSAGDKRVRNTRMLEELGVLLRYPSYREGLAAIVAAADDSPASVRAPPESAPSGRVDHPGD